MFKQVQIVGNIGGNATIFQHHNRQIINFTVAVTDKYKNAEGVSVEKTTWFKCGIWKEPGQSVELAKFLLKGTKVFVQGVPDIETWTTKEGKPTASIKIKVDVVRLLSAQPSDAKSQAEGNRTTQSPESPSTTPEPQPTHDGGDDLPF